MFLMKHKIVHMQNPPQLPELKKRSIKNRILGHEKH